jgi:hypothetical protein
MIASRQKMAKGFKRTLAGLVGGAIGGVAGFLSLFCFADGLILGGRRIPEGLQILGPMIVGAVLGTVAAGDRARRPRA